VNVNVTGALANNSIFNIVDAASGTTGSTVIVTDDSLLYDFLADPTTAGLVQIRVSAVNPIIGALPIISPVLPILAGLPSAQAVAIAAAQLNPGTSNLYAPQESFRATQRFQQLWASHLERTQSACGQGGTIIRENNKKRPPEDTAGCNPDDKHSSVWLAAFGALGEQDNNDGFEGYDTRMSGAMLGYDIPVSVDTRAGLGIRFSRTELDGNTFDTDADVDSYQATAYLGYTPGPWFANAALAYGLDDYSESRHVVFTGVDETVNASYRGHQYTAYGVTGYHLYVDNFRTVITPNASLQYTRLHTNDYTETGDDAITLHVDDQNYNFLQSSLGVKIAHDVALSVTKIVRPELHANWLHSFNNERMKNDASFTSGGSAFRVDGMKNSREVGNVGAGLLFAGDRAWSVEGVYDYQWSHKGYQDNQAMVKFVLHL
jgi:outer membrane autotransporter protein